MVIEEVINIKTLKIKCPNCNKKLIVKIDEDFNIDSIEINDVKISSQTEIGEVLKKNGIEFG